MNKFFAFIILALSLTVFTSCDKDIQINDDYKDITIVYGLLNPSDSLSYLRIEKAFLSDGDIFQAAQIPDSNLYSYKLDVKLFNQDGDLVVVFDTMTIYNKNEGIFYAPVMQVYYAVTKDLLNDNDVYTLKIINPKTGEIQTSSSKLIDGTGVKIDKPNLNITFEKNYAIKFKSIKDARLYQANIRFHYLEENINTGDSLPYYVDWVLPSVTSQSLSGNENLEIPYEGSAFYANLENKIPIKNDVIRREGKIELILRVADEVFNLYLEVNKPSSSLVIDRPAFTNIENGYGLFASRSAKIKDTRLSSGSHNILMNIESLNFKDSDD